MRTGHPTSSPTPRPGPTPWPRRGFRTPVRGHAFAARPPGGQLDAGTPARLVAEPDNPADPLAVAVWVDAPVPWRVGYLDRAVAARLAPRLSTSAPLPAEVVGEVDTAGGWRRPLLAVPGLAAPVGGEVPGRADGSSGGCDRAGRASGRREGPADAAPWGRPPATVRRVLRSR